MDRPRRFTFARVSLFLLIVVVYFVLEGNRKIPSGPASGDSLNAAAGATTQPVGDVLHVATFNIDGGVGKADGIRDLDRTSKTIAGFDLIGLEEVHGGPTPFSADQAQTLGEKLSLPWLFAPVERQWWRDAFGDGVLTALPVIHWQRIPLANEIADSNRELLWVQLRWRDKPLNVLITHLERHADRPAELRTCISLFESLQEPVILMGDLNSYKADPQIIELQKTPGVVDAIGPKIDPQGDCVDWIFARGLKCDSSGLKDNDASDHPLAWAELSVKP